MLGQSHTLSRKGTLDAIVQDVNFLESDVELDRPNKGLSLTRLADDRLKEKKRKR